MNIRPYQSADLETVAALFTASVHHLTAAHYDAQQREAWAPRPPDLDVWRERLWGQRTLVAERHRVLAGFLSYEMNGHIDLLFVGPEHEGCGVASTLYRQAERTLLHAGVSLLFTEASLVARPFFERKGFIATEEQNVRRGAVYLRRYAMRKAVDIAC